MYESYFRGFEMNRLDNNEDDAMASSPSYGHDFPTASNSSGSVTVQAQAEFQVKQEPKSESSGADETIICQQFIKWEDRAKNFPTRPPRRFSIKIAIFVAAIFLSAVVGFINELLFSLTSIRVGFVAVMTLTLICLFTIRFRLNERGAAATMEEETKA